MADHSVMIVALQVLVALAGLDAASAFLPPSPWRSASGKACSARIRELGIVCAHACCMPADVFG